MSAAVVATAALAVLTAVSPAASGAETPGDPYQFAGDCYAMRAPDGRYVQYDALNGYRAVAGAAGAERFRMQASGLGRYMLFDRAQRHLSAGALHLITGYRAADRTSDWRLDPAGTGFVLTSTAHGSTLSVTPGSGTMRHGSAATPIRFEPAQGCAIYPEAEVNAAGAPFVGQTETGEVRGLLDMHLHVMGNEAFGGGLICGSPFDPQGITKALVDCPDHGPMGVGAIWENGQTQAYGPLGAHDTTGWPTFKDFPKANSVTHQQVYWKWLERSWRGGLRVVTLVLVANRELCEVYPVKVYTACSEMDQVRRQARVVHAMQDYIDAQYKGPGNGWFRVVRSPAEARQVVQQGKLAVVLSIETSEPFDCRVTLGVPSCDEADVDAGLAELWTMGVRHMQLINKFDNAMGGVRFDSGPAGVLVNALNLKSTGRFWQAETCPAGQPERDNDIITAEPTGFIGTPLQSLLPGTLPVYPPAPHCNKLGLTSLGAYTINRMMDLGMVVDLDHFSVRATDEALRLIEARGYPGVVSGHSWMDPHFYPRIYKLGGVVTLYGFQSPQFAQEWAAARAAHDAEHAGEFFGFGYGSDANGLGGQPTVRHDAHEHPVHYPFETFDGGTTMDRQRTGSRTFDINVDGVAHYGLRPDWIEDLRVVAGDRIVDDMSKGAEAYLRTWSAAWAVAGS